MEKKTTRPNDTLIGIMLIAVTIIAYGCSGNSETKSNTPKIETVKNDVVQAFDIPALISMDLEALKNALGEPTDEYIPTDVQAAEGVEADYTVTNGRYTLTVSYNTKNKRIKEFFLSDTSGITTEPKELLIAGNLKGEGGENYTVEMQPTMGDDTKFTGAHVRKN